MMKIAFVMPWHISERGGGAEVQANYLAQELGRRGYQVTYICQTIHHNKINSKVDLGFVKVHFLKPSGRFQWLDQNKYINALEEVKPSFVLQRMSSNVSYSIAKYCSQKECKFIWICTDDVNPVKKFYRKRFKTHIDSQKLNLLKKGVFTLNSIIMDYYRDKGMASVDIAFTQNNHQKHLLKENFNLDSFKMISGHPSPRQITPTKEKFEKKRILWCGNLGRHKRPELFIELASKMSGSNLDFVMVGGHADKAYVNQLFKNVPNNLKRTGQLSFDEALKYFDEATIFVNTSVSEGFANTYIQSWLRGLPTFVFGADPDHVISQNRLGFDVKSVDMAIKKLETILSEYESYETMSRNAFNYANKNHSIKVMTDAFLSVLNEESK